MSLIDAVFRPTNISTGRKNAFSDVEIIQNTTSCKIIRPSNGKIWSTIPRYLYKNKPYFFTFDGFINNLFFSTSSTSGMVPLTAIPANANFNFAHQQQQQQQPQQNYNNTNSSTRNSNMVEYTTLPSLPGADFPPLS